MANKKNPMDVKKAITQCFRCDGTGEICNTCGESSAINCRCGGEEGPDIGDCPDCKGTGK